MLVLLVILLALAVLFGVGTALEAAAWLLVVGAVIVGALVLAARSALRRL
jgi:hypothetical protein